MLKKQVVLFMLSVLCSSMTFACGCKHAQSHQQKAVQAKQQDQTDAQPNHG